ncbi:MAG TPA: radical SAM family heme chaperone HemW [Chitinispirillaceae bacterium]|nr:radical SAM family heme chaperone HemW [Chitinispirillaceae bacterium]
MSKLLSLYIHIPFCVRKCRYCDFYSVPYQEDLADRYIEALGKELELFLLQYGWNKPVIDTIFFGGGTPSILSVHQWSRICERIHSLVSLSENCEWTVECNPDSFSEEKVRACLDCGVNRITFGVQSINERELAIMGRVHGAGRVREVLSSSILKKFKSVGVDLIYGLPGQTVGSLIKSLETLLDFEVIQHLSIYELNINKATPFGRHVERLPLPSEDDCYEMALTILDLTKKHCFYQYEVSNFARPGYRCRHNEVYWNHDAYIGIGTGAHSYIDPLRLADNNTIISYIDAVSKGNFPSKDIEEIDSEILAREMIFLGIRRSDGIDEERFLEKTGFCFEEYTDRHKLDQLINNGLIIKNGRFWQPTRQGLLMSDAIARDLIRYENTV